MRAKKSNSLLDQAVLAPFSETFKVMGISIDDLEDKFYDIAGNLPELDAATQLKLESDGLILEGGWSNSSIVFSTPNRYIIYKNRPMLVYIRDQYLRAEQYRANNFSKFHLCFCNQLRKKQKKGKYKDRYVITYRTSGSFLVNIWERDRDYNGRFYEIEVEKGVFKKLNVCQDCLRELNWENFQSYCGNNPDDLRIGTTYYDMKARSRIVKSFSIEKFLRKVKRDLFEGTEQLNTAIGAFENVYGDLTPEQKEKIKLSRGCVCEKCGKTFPLNQLEIHHKSSGRFNNSAENLAVVCKRCHDEEHADRVSLTHPRLEKSCRVFEAGRNLGVPTKKIFSVLALHGIQLTNNFSMIPEDGVAILNDPKLSASLWVEES